MQINGNCDLYRFDDFNYAAIKWEFQMVQTVEILYCVHTHTHSSITANKMGETLELKRKIHDLDVLHFRTTHRSSKKRRKTRRAHNYFMILGPHSPDR